MKILHSELSDTIGGIETFLLNVSQNIDLGKYKFEIMTTVVSPVYEKEFDELNIPVHKLPSVRHFFKYYKEFSKLLKDNKYDIVHIHKNSLANPLPILMAKRYCRNIVIHSHNTRPSKGKLTVLLHKINKKFINTESFLKFACGEEAAEWMYGKSAEKEKDYFLIKNGIDVEKFCPDMQERERVRTALGIQQEYVLCNVGRFTEQKNHSFLIEIFADFHKRVPESKLLLVGTGPLLEDIKRKVAEMSLVDEVLFLGQRKDIPQILQAADIFVFPSLYEGLGIVGIEAQAAGLAVVASNSIPREVDVTDRTIFLGLSEKPAVWSDSIVYCMQNGNEHNTSYIKQCFDEKGYNIVETVNKLTHLYNQYAERKN